MNALMPTPSPDGACCGFDELHHLVAEGYQFGTIYADPPWPYRNQRTRAATSNHYPSMTLDQLCDPNLMPIAQLAAKDAHLHLWTTNSFLLECFRIFYAWGFKYESTFVWVKPSIGLGNYWRNAHELLLTAVRGSAADFSESNRPPSWLKCARSKHSEKPHQMRDMITRWSPGPRWLSWGNQIEKDLFSKSKHELVGTLDGLQ
jgi:N6-adenosine-specific RNA methylase IME4